MYTVSTITNLETQAQDQTQANAGDCEVTRGEREAQLHQNLISLVTNCIMDNICTKKASSWALKRHEPVRLVVVLKLL